MESNQVRSDRCRRANRGGRPGNRRGPGRERRLRRTACVGIRNCETAEEFVARTVSRWPGVGVPERRQAGFDTSITHTWILRRSVADSVSRMAWRISSGDFGFRPDAGSAPPNQNTT